MILNRRYIVNSQEAGNTSNTVTYKIFDTEDDAVKYFNEQVEDYITRTISDNELSEEEAKQYRSELRKYKYSVIDPDDEWSVGIVTETLTRGGAKDEI